MQQRITLSCSKRKPADNKQYKRKFNRFHLLEKFYRRLKQESPQKSDPPHEIVFHLIRYPPPNNEGPVRLPAQAKITTQRKGTNRTLKWSKSPVTVIRWNESGKPDKGGDQWRCKPS